MSYVSVIVSGAASLGVLIGLLSGIFFLVLTGLRWVSRVREALYEEELQRQKKIIFSNANSVGSVGQDFLETRTGEDEFGNGFGESHQEKKPQSFQSNVGNGRNWNEKQAEEKASEKEGKIMTHSGKKTSGLTHGIINPCGRYTGIAESFSRNNRDKELRNFLKDGARLLSEMNKPSSDTIQVREFIEKMVETLIGGPLDGTTVGQLSNHSAYLGMFTKYHNLLCRELARLGFALQLSVVRKRALDPESSNLSQCNLKRLIKRIVSEAMTLPNIKEILCRPKTVKETVNDDFKNKSYEDILATAILNKVIEHFQNRENATTDRKPKPRPRSKNMSRNPEDEDQKSNSDWSDASRSDQLSLTIEEYIEEVTTALEASEDERSDFSDFETNVNRRIPFPEAGRTVVDGTDDENSDEEGHSSATELFTSTSSWEENWLFQKKRLRSTPNAHHPVPVPMLVPNPSEDYRALVGGVDADDLSDMSDCSDLILEDPKGEKKSFNQLSNEGISCNTTTDELDENENEKSKADDEKEIVEENSPKMGKGIDSNFENTNLTAVSEAEVEGSEGEVSEDVKLNSSPTSPSQKDREFSVEDFDILQQCESSCRSESSFGGTLTSTGSENGNIRSRIAEREKEKWSNPVPLADNPYSLENIERRAQRKKNDFFRIGTYTGESIDFPEDLSSDELTKSSENLRFTRDYYVNGSKNPSGKSSPSLSRLSKGHDQTPSANENGNALLKTRAVMMQEPNHETSDAQKINKKEFSLPSVKELAKQFMLQDAKETKRIENELGKKPEKKQKSRSLDGAPGREPELDYSTIPVSEIVSNLQQSKQSPVQPNKTIESVRPKTQIEICRKSSADDRKTGAVRFNGKEVHSLTARSISKEFREGLKNNSYQNVFLKINRAAINGENEQRDMVYSEEKTSPMQSIDLKNMKKFWEEMITANANASKQK